MWRRPPIDRTFGHVGPKAVLCMCVSFPITCAWGPLQCIDTSVVRNLTPNLEGSLPICPLQTWSWYRSSVPTLVGLSTSLTLSCL